MRRHSRDRPLSEFDLIERFFRRCGATRPDVTLGIGDDAALLAPPPGMELAITTDTLVEGVHFVAGADPRSLGHKSLAVNLSDLAAMGAEPAWATLALTVPNADESWLREFAQGFCALASAQGVALVGGDTTRGPRSITVQLAGFVPAGEALRRDGATPGDLVCVSGELGAAGLALLAQQGLYVRLEALPALRERLDRPQPRLALGRELRRLATSAIDISDGLGSDLGHILTASGCGARIEVERVPMSETVAEYVRETGDWHLPLAAGDDYELGFTIPERRQGELDALAVTAGVPVRWIGWIERAPGLRWILADGSELDQPAGGYDHFREA